MRFCILSLLLLSSLTCWSQINWSGPFTNVCPGETYTYSISVESYCASPTSIDCSGCSDVIKDASNSSITLKWLPGSISRSVSATAMCTEPDNLNNPSPVEYSDGRSVSLVQPSKDIYFCSLDAESYYTTTETAEETDYNNCTTTARWTMLSYTDFSGSNLSPFVNYNTDFNITLLGFPNGQANDGGQGQLWFKWRSGWEGKVTFKVQYVMKNKNAFDHCNDGAVGDMNTYTFVRTDDLPSGTLNTPSTIAFNGTSTDINLPFVKTNSNVPILKIKYFLGTEQIYESENFCGFNCTYATTQPGTFTFTTLILTPCGSWITGPNKTIKVTPSCAGASASSRITGNSLIRWNEGYEITKDIPYTIEVSGIDDLFGNYILTSDIGTDGQLSGSIISVSKEMGSYHIFFANKTGREECPVIPVINLFLGGKDEVIADDKCPIELPKDFSKFGFPDIIANNIVLQHFKGTVKSETSIIVMPGITLDLGAELVLEAGIEQPENDEKLNFVEQTTFDEYGRVLGANRNYYDYFGRPTQSQSKNLDAGVVLATQTIYDVYGRAALSTLPAPVSVRGSVDNSQCGVAVVDQGLSFLFKNNFIKAADGTAYDYKAFDLSLSTGTTISKEETPLAVENTEPGTLGWYHSANNGGAIGDFAKINEPLVAATQYPYSRTLFHRDGSGETKGSTKPGDVFRAGANNTAVANNEPVPATDTYLSSYLDVYDEVYTRPALLAGQFFRTVAYDEEDNKSMSYTDKSGKTIISLYFGKQASPITTSYSIYDQAGRLKVSISPNGVGQFTASPPVAFADIDKTTFTYNYKGWLLSSTEKDAGTSNFVYRRDGKLRFSQNAQQLLGGKFSYTNYDRSGRAIESGECTGEFAFDQATLESIAADGGLTGVRTDQVTTLYDEADPAIPGSRLQRFVHGAVSRSGNANSTTWYSYDERGRVEWVVQDIAGFGVKTLDYRYGPSGAVQEVIYQKGKKDVQGQPDEQFSHFYTYDHNGRLSKAYTTTSLLDYNKEGELTNSNVLTLQATYYYYIHGPLKRVEYAGNVQGIDYVYTADGALKSINDAVLANDPGKDGQGTPAFIADVFGMTLDYYSGDYLSHSFIPSSSVTPAETEDQFTGLIKANRWHSPIQGNVPAGYAYRYDARHQMKDARWLTNIPGITNPYYEHIYAKDNNDNEIDGYDANGNIRFLTRKNELGIDIADFEYHYQGNSNKLQSITSPNNQNKAIRNYTYNAIGQMTEQEDVEANKKLITHYDVTGKVTEVRDQDDHLVTTYTYDDRGFRLSKITYESGTPKLKTWYVRDASGNMVSTYEDNLTDQLVAAPTEVPVYGSGRIGLYKPQYGLTFYELTDHLGNVRAVIGKPVTATYLATMESERVDKEGDFIGIAPRVISSGMNHTPSTVVIAEDNESTVIASPDEVIRINNGMDNPRNPIGGGILLPVHPGDKIDAEVFVRYTNFDGGVNNSPLTGMAAYLAQSFGAPVSVIDGVNIFHGIDENPNGIFSALANADDGLPLAFLTYVVYDRDMVPVLFDQAQAGTSAANGYQPLNLSDITIDKEGFVYIYVSNQSPQNMEVFFDDLKVVHHYSDIVGGGDYYPFGLEINDRRITRVKHHFGYQGLYAEKDEETGWNHFELREYDPVVGRWMQKDPASQHYSPYIGMGNNPISKTDPNGGRDWVEGEDGGIFWDPKAKSQDDVCIGCTYLGEDLTFSFSSFIDRADWDGPNPWFDVSGEKLYNAVTLNFSQDSKGNLLGLTDVSFDHQIMTNDGGFTGIPSTSLGSSQIKAIGSNNFTAGFENHTEVPLFEAMGLMLQGYARVDVAQKLIITGSISGGTLNYKSFTDIFPSASLSINGTKVMYYRQPLYKETHGLFTRPAPALFERQGVSLKRGGN